ncbi:MAG: P27 family phage terminase small subunit [Acidimicrobiales bacterium]
MSTSQRPPGHLSKSTKAWWSLVASDYSLEQWQLLTLTAACEAWDRGAEAREQVTKDGLQLFDRFGQAKVHPLLAVERDCRLSFLRAVRELALEVVDEPAEVRPPRIRAVK